MMWNLNLIKTESTENSDIKELIVKAVDQIEDIVLHM